MLRRKMFTSSALMAPRQRTRSTPCVDGYSLRKMALMSNLAMPRVADQMLDKPAIPAYVEGPAVTWHWQKIKQREYKRQEKVEFGQKRA